MIQPIRKYGDPCLTTVCESVSEIGDEERRILDDMEDTMREYHCVGLSAPQIGVCRRLFIVAAGGVFIRGANPEVLSAGSLSEDVEGSPCIPGIQRPVRRPKKILCRYLDESGEIVETELKGIAARAFCHEMDHHEGKMFIDHLKPAQRKLIQKELDRIAGENI